MQRSTELKIEIMRSLNEGKSEGTAIYDRLSTKGYKLQKSEVYHHLKSLGELGWAKITETKHREGGGRGRPTVNIWEARRGIPSEQEVLSARRRAPNENRPVHKAQPQAKKPMTSVDPEVQVAFSKTGVVAKFSAFEVSIEKAARIVDILRG